MTESEVREFLTRYFNAALYEPVDVYLDLLTEDVILEDPVGTPPLRGRAAIGQYLSAGRAMLERADYEVRDVIACGRESAARWSAHLRTKRGQELAVEGIGTFTFNEEGKLRHVREFYDAALLLAIFSKEA